MFYFLYATFPCDKNMYTWVILYPNRVYVLKHLKKLNFLNYGRRSRVLPVDYLLVPVAQLFPTKKLIWEKYKKTLVGRR